MQFTSRWPRTVRFIRIILLAYLAITALFLLLLGIHRGLLPLVALALPQLETSFYDLAVYGVYRTRGYETFDAVSPRVNLVRWDDVCDQGHVFLGLYGDSIATPGPYILDARGNLVWFTEEFKLVTNFHMQTYRGQNYLTFWAGRKVEGVGVGAMYMLDSSYMVAHRIEAVGEHLDGDLHEFKITDQGTALVTIYNKTQADLRELGLGRGEHGWVSDCIFQEIDIATGKLLFQWVASEHLKPGRTFYTHPMAGFFPMLPFDYFHINSIQKDSKGNYLISSRHFHTLTYIDGTSGKILWELGGDSIDFTDLSNGKATDFKWQHHARWLSEEEGLISLFDNGVAGPLHVDAPTSKGSLIRLDLDNMTATHVQSYYPSAHVLSSSQGSVQALPGGRLFSGWGSSGMWTEHSLDGTLLCEVHFSASIVYAWEWVKTYRTFKAFDWVGKPTYPPSVKIVRNNLFVSWNGATEVRTWQLQSHHGVDASGKDEFEIVDELPRQGFETSFSLPAHQPYRLYRVVALDSKGNVLGVSNPTAAQPPKGSLVLILVIVGLILIGIALGCAWFYRAFFRRSMPRNFDDINLGQLQYAPPLSPLRAKAAGWVPWARSFQHKYTKL